MTATTAATWLGFLFLALTVLGGCLMLIANLGLVFQLVSYVTLRRASLAQERERLASPLPPDDELPDVVLQIPTFNEGSIVERGIANAMALDWPKSRLHVQICDDSTDQTTGIARAAAAKAMAQGFDVAVLHRDDRTAFKAGALQAAMNQTPHEYFVILDVDYVSPPDFLRRCMAVLLTDPSLAFVQARPDFLNIDTNLLTRSQTLLLDYHYAVEQATRSWSGQALPFNGTCGVWRRTAIELGGGWRGETLTEDWELSYHARLKGMRGTFVTSVTAAGELPADLPTWMTQQQRWSKGTGQVAWKMLPQALAARAGSARERFNAIFPLLQWFLNTTFTATYLFAIPAMLLLPSTALWLGVSVYVVYAISFWVMFATMLTGSKAAGRHRPLWRFAVEVIAATFLLLYVSWAHFWSVPAIVLGRPAVFMRTPKRGAAAA
jgi:cellulose synthase/poly-beta-1,6-N-acetylglucosamine synthase-like glycosyltransferase